MDKENLVMLKEQFKTTGNKNTKARNAVLEALVEVHCNHLSAEEIYNLVKQTHPKIGLTTVYRTLKLLESEAIICKLDLDDGFIRYELNKPNENHSHHHLICSRCGSVAEVEDDLLDCLEDQILIKNKFLVKNHRVKFYGLCEKCKD